MKATNILNCALNFGISVGNGNPNCEKDLMYRLGIFLDTHFDNKFNKATPTIIVFFSQLMQSLASLLID
jgi:hypothetical protein